MASTLDIVIKLQKSGNAPAEVISTLKGVGTAAESAGRSMQGVGAHANSLESILKKLALVGGAVAAFRALEGVVGSVAGVVKSAVGDAFQAIRSYESMNLALRQLTATQFLQAGAAQDMAQALQMAEQPASDLLNWIERLAIKSPFGSDTVANVISLAEGFQFSQNEAKRLTQDLVDLASARNKLTPEYIERLTDAFGKMNTKGKVSLEELNRIMEAGVPALDVLGREFGKTSQQMSDMISRGAVPAGVAIRALEEYIETNFKGAAERATDTWQGMTTSLDDIKSRDLRALFSGMFDAVQPEAAKVINWLGSDEFYGELKQVGSALGEGMKTGVATAEAVINGLARDDGPLATVKKLFNFDDINTKGIKTAFADVVTSIGLAGVEVYGLAAKFVIMADTAVKAIGQIETKFNELSSQYQTMVAIVNFLNNPVAGIAAWTYPWVYNLAHDAVAPSAGPTAQGGAKTLAEQLAEIDAKRDEMRRAITGARQSVVNPMGPPLPSDTPAWAKSFGGLFGGKAATVPGKDLPTQFEEAGDKLAQKIVSAFDKVTGKITGMIDSATSAARGIIDLSAGRIGAGGAFDKLYGLADYISGPVDRQIERQRRANRRAAQTEFAGNLGEATDIQRQFQLGNLTDPRVFARIDWAKFAKQATDELMGERTTQYAGQAVAALMSAGKPITAQNLRDTINQLAAQDKEPIVPALRDLQAALGVLADGQHTDLANLLAAVQALDLSVTVQVPPAATTRPASQAAPPGAGASPPWPVSNSYAPGGGWQSAGTLVSLPQGVGTYGGAARQALGNISVQVTVADGAVRVTGDAGRDIAKQIGTGVAKVIEMIVRSDLRASPGASRLLPGAI
jgi:tape measure domain-containing protein